MAEEKKHAAPKPAGDKPHHIKVTQMSRQEVEAALENCQKTMGGLHSQYARALLAQKEFLGAQPANELPKAA